MNEEIDIIELLKRVKEGNAPKEIEVEGSVFKFRDTIYNINELYSNGTFLWFIKGITLNTKIKILDKPIIEELPMTETVPNFDRTTTITQQKAYSTDELADKINEIIRVINNKENKDE